MLLTLVMALGGFLLYYWYMRRVLEHLDPTKAIPDRVRKALDTLTEGVIVLDTSGRIVLANETFRRSTARTRWDSPRAAPPRSRG